MANTRSSAFATEQELEATRRRLFGTGLVVSAGTKRMSLCAAAIILRTAPISGPAPHVPDATFKVVANGQVEELIFANEQVTDSAERLDESATTRVRMLVASPTELRSGRSGRDGVSHFLRRANQQCDRPDSNRTLLSM
jgi:hypothetical protein